MRYVLITIGGSLMACRSDKGVTVFNPNPEAVITSHDDGTAVLEGQQTLFVGNVTDPNHRPEQLQVIWYNGSEVVCEADIPQSNGSTSCELSIGMESEITLEVLDPDNARGAHSINLDVTPSQIPQAEILRPQAVGYFYSDQKITLEGSVFDQEDPVETLEVFWESDIDGSLNVANTPDSAGLVIGASYLSEGEHFVLMRVRDSSGKEASDDVTITVGPPNTPPLCSILEPLDGGIGGLGELLALQGTASDVDVPTTMLEASWSSSIDGVLGTAMVNSDGTILLPYTGLSSGTHVLTLTVQDEKEASCTDSILFTVGTPPQISILQPLDQAMFNEGETIAFSVEVSDAQESAELLDLIWTLNGNLYSNHSAASHGLASFEDSSLSAGQYTLQVSVYDGEGLSESAQINFEINGLPSQPDVSLSPQPAYTGDELMVTFDTSSTDPEGQSISYSYAWFVNDQPHSHTGATLSSSETQAGEVWSVQVTPSDGLGEGAYGEAQISIADTAPTIIGQQITPSTGVYNDSTLTCSAQVVDPDETLLASITWYSGSLLLQQGSTIDLSQHSIAVGDSITCQAQTIDSSGQGATSNSAVLVENRVPVISSVSLSPVSVYTSDVLSAQVVVSDPDGESTMMHYEWYVDGAVVQSGSQDTLDGNSYFSKDESVYVAVTPSDTHGSGIMAQSSPITVLNTPPSAPVLVMVDALGQPLGNTVSSTEDIFCAIDIPSTDEDGDGLSYDFSWSEGGTGWSGATQSLYHSADGISAADTLTGDQWTCDVQAYDGDDYSSFASADVDIAPEYVWEEVGSQEVEFAYGSCSSTQTQSVTCSASHVGEKIYVHPTEYQGNKRLQYKFLGQQVHYSSVLMDVPGARGYAVSLSTDETTLSWTGAVSCGGDDIVTRTATVYECIEN